MLRPTSQSVHGSMGSVVHRQAQNNGQNDMLMRYTANAPVASLFAHSRQHLRVVY